jgi:1,4-alpha-glucan branching enzyme
MVTVKDNWVEFSFYRPNASKVHLVGDFNNWRDGELPMQRAENGYWRASMRLPGGMFKFRYRADGRWFADYAAFGLEYGPFGFDSCVLVRAENRKAAS